MPCSKRWASIWAQCSSIPSSPTTSHSAKRCRRAMSSPPSSPFFVKRMRLSAPRSTSPCFCIRRVIPATDGTEEPSPSVGGSCLMASVSPVTVGVTESSHSR